MVVIKWRVVVRIVARAGRERIYVCMYMYDCACERDRKKEREKRINYCCEMKNDVCARALFLYAINR